MPTLFVIREIFQTATPIPAVFSGGTLTSSGAALTAFGTAIAPYIAIVTIAVVVYLAPRLLKNLSRIAR
jgi:hypothetical protein